MHSKSQEVVYIHFLYTNQNESKITLKVSFYMNFYVILSDLC